MLLGVATVQAASGGGTRVPFAASPSSRWCSRRGRAGRRCGLAAAGDPLVRALAAAPWRLGTLRIAGPATMRVVTLEGDVDLRLQSTTIWRTRAVQHLDGQDVRVAEVGGDRWVLTADGAGTLYGARRP